MKSMIHKFRYLIPISLLIILITLFPLFSIVFEDVFTRWDINNPYVNSNFTGWKSVSVRNQYTFNIPLDWTLQHNDGVFLLVDDSGEIWAWGAMYGTEESSFHTYKEFVTSFAQIQVESVNIDPYTDFVAMKGADIDRLDALGVFGEKTFYFIELMRTSGPTFVLFLREDISDSTDDYNIAEAIAYSFAYM